jgi:hypothetical protein
VGLKATANAAAMVAKVALNTESLIMMSPLVVND